MEELSLTLEQFSRICRRLQFSIANYKGFSEGLVKQQFLQESEENELIMYQDALIKCGKRNMLSLQETNILLDMVSLYNELICLEEEPDKTMIEKVIEYSECFVMLDKTLHMLFHENKYL